RKGFHQIPRRYRPSCATAFRTGTYAIIIAGYFVGVGVDNGKYNFGAFLLQGNIIIIRCQSITAVEQTFICNLVGGIGFRPVGIVVWVCRVKLRRSFVQKYLGLERQRKAAVDLTVLW